MKTGVGLAQSDSATTSSAKPSRAGAGTQALLGPGGDPRGGVVAAAAVSGTQAEAVRALESPNSDARGGSAHSMGESAWSSSCVRHPPHGRSSQQQHTQTAEEETHNIGNKHVEKHNTHNRQEPLPRARSPQKRPRSRTQKEQREQTH